MCVKLSAKVWAMALPSSEKLVLLALADKANVRKGNTAWPSIASISKLTGLSERTVQGAIKTLCASGNITRREVIGKGAVYTVHPRSDCTPANAAPPQNLQDTPAATAPKPLKEPLVVVSAGALPTSVRAKPDFVLPDWVPADAWDGFLEMRKRKRANPTERAKQLLIGKLEKLTPDHGDAGAILDQSTAGGWTDIYELKGQSNGRTGKPERNKVTDNPMVLAFARMAGHIDADGNPTPGARRCDATGSPPSAREHSRPALVALPGVKHH